MASRERVRAHANALRNTVVGCLGVRPRLNYSRARTSDNAVEDVHSAGSPWAETHAREGAHHTQHGVWITLWKVCAKRRAACAQRVWKTLWVPSTGLAFSHCEQGFSVPPTVERDVLEVAV